MEKLNFQQPFLHFYESHEPLKIKFFKLLKHFMELSIFMENIYIYIFSE